MHLVQGEAAEFCAAVEERLQSWTSYRKARWHGCVNVHGCVIVHGCVNVHDALQIAALKASVMFVSMQ